MAHKNSTYDKKEEINKMTDLQLANNILKYSNGQYIELLLHEGIARLLGRLR